jgi:hypothetical protein
MNNKFKITISHPLVRPGLKIETEASERYLVSVVNKALTLVREINNPDNKSLEEELKRNPVDEIAASCGWNPLTPGEDMIVHFNGNEYHIKHKEKPIY